MSSQSASAIAGEFGDILKAPFRGGIGNQYSKPINDDHGFNIESPTSSGNGGSEGRQIANDTNSIDAAFQNTIADENESMSISKEELDAKLARNKAEVDAVAARMQSDMAQWRERMSLDLREIKELVSSQHANINARLDLQASKIESSVNAQSSKIDAALAIQESKLELKLSDVKFEIIKWVLGLPSLVFAFYKIYEAFKGSVNA